MAATGYCEYGQHAATWKDVGADWLPDERRWRTICYRCDRDRQIAETGGDRSLTDRDPRTKDR